MSSPPPVCAKENELTKRHTCLRTEPERSIMDIAIENRFFKPGAPDLFIQTRHENKTPGLWKKWLKQTSNHQFKKSYTTTSGHFFTPSQQYFNDDKFQLSASQGSRSSPHSPHTTTKIQKVEQSWFYVKTFPLKMKDFCPLTFLLSFRLKLHSTGHPPEVSAYTAPTNRDKPKSYQKNLFFLR